MSLSSRANLANFAIALCAACASQRSAESHADYVAEAQTTRTEGAERVTVLEFGPPGPVGLADAGLPPVSGARPFAQRSSLSAHGPLLKATITDRGIITTNTKSGTDFHTDAESNSRWRVGPGFWGWVGLAFGAVAAALLAWKFRGGLAGVALKLIGR